MIKKIFTLLIFSVFLGSVHSHTSASTLSEDPIVVSYQRNFIRAGISTKLELLSGASEIPSVNMTPLYSDALYFAISSFYVLGEDRQLVDIACSAVNAAAAGQDPSILPSIYEIFPLFTNSVLRISCINAIAKLSGPEGEGFEFLKTWFASALDDCESGKFVDPRIMTSALEAFAVLGNPSVFPFVFRAAVSNLDSSVVAAAGKTINSLNEGYTDNILSIILEKNPEKTQAAFSFAVSNENLQEADLGMIAENVFNTMLEVDSQGNPDAAPVLESSLEVLTRLKWFRASPSVLRYFYRMQSEYKTENIGAEKLIPVINCLGAMGTTEAAQALSIFLGLMNSETEQKKTCNENLMLSIINALGDLGDKSAFDYLLYVGYLDYPESVKQASRDALARLKW